jgi:hypothetical protein
MKLEKLLSRLEACARPIILEYFRPDSCIASTHILIRVLDHFGVHAEPLPLKIVVGNKPFWRLVADGKIPPATKEMLDKHGAWSVGIDGKGALVLDGRGLPGYSGHLVAYCPQHNFFLDGSLDQANRPHKNIIVPGLVRVPVPRLFFSKLDPHLALHVDFVDCAVEYYRHDDFAFRLSIDWLDHKRVKAPVRRIVEQLTHNS